jgi:hypothetical protein
VYRFQLPGNAGYICGGLSNDLIGLSAVEEGHSWLVGS